MRYKGFEKKMVALVCALMMVFTCQNTFAVTEETEAFDAGPFIIEHVIDSYGWHICGDGDKSVTIPLPVILFDEGRPVVFLSN